MNRIITTVIAAGFLGIIAGCASGTHSVPVPDVTGSYSTAGLLPERCHHTGPGWVTEPSEMTDGVSFRVKDAYYCDGLTGGVITPVKGDPYNMYISFMFSKARPEEST